LEFVGTPDNVAADMGGAIAEIGRDGFLIDDPPIRHLISEITDGLAPGLQRRVLAHAA
jgi:alkanesulfonate monooxygenase SsuD/methylene tetrahydromethanopterin reductase-like flavin-dependent oxidoreductase (luciferase family)